MPESGRAQVVLTSEMEPAEEVLLDEVAPDPGGVFSILAMGDFGSAAEGSDSALTPIDIDRDNFDDALARLAPGLPLEWAGASGSGEPTTSRLSFSDLEDFHPDRLVRRLPRIDELMRRREELDDPERFRVEVPRRTVGGGASQPVEPVPPVSDQPDLLEQILEGMAKRPSAEAASDPHLERFVSRVVEPHAIRIDSRLQERLLGKLDAALADTLRVILHHPAFQALEAAWRSLRELVDSVETGPRLKIQLLQISKEELRSDVASRTDLRDSRLGRLFLEELTAPGSRRPTLLLGNYFFGGDDGDLRLLERLGWLAKAVRAPFVAAASPRLLGVESFPELDPRELERWLAGTAMEGWRGLRRSPAARYIALAMPRVLLRLPYGADTDPVESFQFEEIEGEPEHGSLLWGNSAFKVASVIGDLFAKEGWGFDLAGRAPRLRGLPLYTWRRGEGAATTPCAEALLGERAVGALVEAGLLPLISYRGQDVAAMPYVQSIAHPRSGLRWG